MAEERMKLVNNITHITDTSGVELKDFNLAIEFSQKKYSAKKTAIWHLLLNGKSISRKDIYNFIYTCVTCGSKHKITTVSLLRKINKCSHECIECVNLNVQKRATHSANFASYIKSDEHSQVEQVIKTYVQKRDECLVKFNALDDDYKQAYFNTHLTPEDYTRISKNIISFHNGKYTDLTDIEYWPVYNSTNQMTFTHMMYHKSQGIIFKPHQPILKCDNCDEHWRAKSIERFKNCVHIQCKTCSLVNNTFILRRYQNVNREPILYQSKLELKFINWCNNNGIVVKNGPIIPYTFAGKERTYRVDFIIVNANSSDNILIEIKDNHVWHRNDLESGKWQAKESAANEQVNKGIYKKYMMITPVTWMSQTKALLAELNLSLNKIKTS
jgi:hypothetical protein